MEKECNEKKKRKRQPIVAVNNTKAMGRPGRHKMVERPPVCR